MDKNSVIKHYAETNEERDTLSHILDLAERSRLRDIVESGNFMSDALRMRTDEMLSRMGYDAYFFFGGYEGAERTCPVFYTEYCTSEVIAETPDIAEIVFLKATLDRFNKGAELSHRDVLGSLMGLGIERDAVGDIIIDEGFVIIAVRESISAFILDSLLKISRYPVSVSVVEKPDIKRKDDFEEGFDTVASLRLDAVASSLFSTSRSNSADAIEMGLVAVNGATVKKTDSAVSEGDKISWRGNGRAQIEKIDGLSKKGRVRILYKRWK